MKTFFLVRHGQTDWNIQRRMQGHSDIPLNDAGRIQAQSLISFFENQNLDFIVSSDLCRAHETALIFSQPLGMTPLKDSRLREVFLGDMEGLTKDEIIQLHGEESWNRWGSNSIEDLHFKWPGSESRIEQVERFKKLFGELLKMDHKKIAVVTHGLAIRTFIHYLEPELTEPIQIPNCVVYKLENLNEVWAPAVKIFEAP